MRALLALVLSGCSFAFVTAPPKQAAPPTAECTESYIAPVADLALAAGGGALAIGLTASAPGCNSGDCTASNIGGGVARTAGALMLIPTLIYAISSYRGFTDVGACRRLHARPTPSPPNPDLI
ncbi:MAG: hypothetical protein ACM31C_14835 [Acidobacteriota bacterium]